ncbi:efflux RND transporter periplasmic adaptor subunit [Cohnella pontilimi]|uniref:efflux RND transporter periplasmic adaptor subunit n=1 Tax=Cohnella pontilimi TaxID=2564100 RepID=UPI00145C8177|nr:efflux RND transporter periplasmic adaptor subunit [Cohnella pontilimi]
MSRHLKQAVKAVTAVVTAAAVLAGCSLLPREEQPLKAPLVKPASENYRTVKVTQGNIVKQVTGSGSLESVATDVAQFTGQGGRIASVAVHPGDQVKKGDLLVQLIMDGLDLQLKEQQLALERAKYAYSQAKKNGSDADALRIASLQTDIEQIKYDRLSKQFNSKQLRARIDGQVIFAEDLKEGDLVEAYQTLVTVADPTKLRVALRVENSNDIKDVDVGMTAEITLKNETVQGKVVQTPSSSPMTLNKDLADKYSRTLYIEVPQLPKAAEIGSSVDVKIVTQKKDNVLKIPRSGLRSYLGRNFVRVLEDGKRIREVDVEQGVVTPTEVEIVRGLQEGQDVILQ